MKTTFAFLILAAFGALKADETIQVTGDAEIKVVPDQVILSLGVEVHSKLLMEARSENDRRVRAVRAAAVKAGAQDKDVQTDFIQLGIVYQDDGVTPKYYYARKSIVITLQDINRMEEALSSAVDAGATHIHGVQFETTKLREHRDRARALAVQAATDKARDMAAAAGLKVVGGPVNISSWSSGARSWYGNGWDMPRGMMAQNVVVDAGAGGASAGTVALGRISVTAAVSMQFRIQ